MMQACCCRCQDPTRRPPANAQSSYTVSYNSESHIEILTQCWGSTWLKVLPYCMFNVTVMAVLTVIDKRFHGAYTVNVSTQGHTFMTLVVAFLLVSRVNTALSRYLAARDALGLMYRESRDLTQGLCAYTLKNTNLQAKEWRNKVTYQILILLRTSMAVIDYPTTNVPAWEVPELTGDELLDVQKSVLIHPEPRRYAHDQQDIVRSEAEESMRVPIRLAYVLRKSLVTQEDHLTRPMQLAQENRLLANVDGFMTGYYGIRKFMTTPTPFPLIQMARTFLFLFVFTVPFVMVGDSSSDIAHILGVFMITYGFFGLEVVSIELDNPFGDDPNDFSNYGMACTAFEDTYLTILDIDGNEWTDKLRKRMHDGALHEAHPTEQSFLLDKMV